MFDFDFEDLLINFHTRDKNNKKEKNESKKSKVLVNEKEYPISSTKEIRIEGEDVYINGDKVKIEPSNDKINITIIGDIENLKIGSCNNFKVEGNIETILSPIICDNLVGDIEKVNGTVKAKVFNGNIEKINGTTIIESIKGNIEKVNGNMIKRD